MLAEGICQCAIGTGGPTNGHKGEHVEADVQGAHVEHGRGEEAPHCRVDIDNPSAQAVGQSFAGSCRGSCTLASQWCASG